VQKLSVLLTIGIQQQVNANPNQLTYSDTTEKLIYAACGDVWFMQMHKNVLGKVIDWTENAVEVYQAQTTVFLIS